MAGLQSSCNTYRCPSSLQRHPQLRKQPDPDIRLGEYFKFVNRNRDRFKIIWWDRSSCYNERHRIMPGLHILEIILLVVTKFMIAWRSRQETSKSAAIHRTLLRKTFLELLSDNLMSIQMPWRVTHQSKRYNVFLTQVL
ncbi:MAG: hypothetical protein U0930_21265 [Pirellulales bacterium]